MASPHNWILPYMECIYKPLIIDLFQLLRQHKFKATVHFIENCLCIHFLVEGGVWQELKEYIDAANIEYLNMKCYSV